jgi:hypothetical protein
MGLRGAITNWIQQVKNGVRSYTKLVNFFRIYVLLFRTMSIMSSCYLFIHRNVKTKNPFNEILGLSFDLRHLKLNTYYIKKSQFCKRIVKNTLNTFWWKKNEKDKNLLAKFKKHSYIKNKVVKSDVMCPFCVGCHVRSNVHQNLWVTKNFQSPNQQKYFGH